MAGGPVRLPRMPARLHLSILLAVIIGSTLAYFVPMKVVAHGQRWFVFALMAPMIASWVYLGSWLYRAWLEDEVEKKGLAALGPDLPGRPDPV